jgi:anti-sigma regulatory factor (Ser/Thr protein kinase)
MGRIIDLEIPPQNRHLALVRRAVATAARQHRLLPDRRVDDLSLAVSEAVANGIDAQAAVGRDEPVRVRIDLQREAIAVTVVDHGGGFIPDAVDPVPAAEDPRRLRHERGLGLALMRNLTDHVRWDRTGEGTTVTLEIMAPG